MPSSSPCRRQRQHHHREGLAPVAFLVSHSSVQSRATGRSGSTDQTRRISFASCSLRRCGRAQPANALGGPTTCMGSPVEFFVIQRPNTMWELVLFAPSSKTRCPTRRDLAPLALVFLECVWPKAAVGLPVFAGHIFRRWRVTGMKVGSDVRLQVRGTAAISGLPHGLKEPAKGFERRMGGRSDSA